MTDITKPGTDRRTIIKGAAWSGPVLAASVAAPIAAATETPPDCPDCLRPGAGAYELAGLAASNRATLVMAAAIVLDATDCGSILGNIFDFQPAFTYVITSATLTMSNGSTYNSLVGLGPGAGVLGAVGAFPSAFTFTNVRVAPTGAFGSEAYTGIFPPIRPTKLTVTINTTFKWGLGAQILCPHVLEWDLPAIGVGALALGAGVVTYTGVAAGIY